MTQFKGRQFSGRQFVGRHFRAADGAVQVPPDFAPTWGPKVYPKKSPRRRDRDDDVLLFLLR